MLLSTLPLSASEDLLLLLSRHLHHLSRRYTQVSAAEIMDQQVDEEGTRRIGTYRR